MEDNKEPPKDLRAWLDVAKSKGLKYHSWIDTYLGSESANTEAASAGVETIGAGVSAWLVRNSADPEPVQPWYTAARYFARELVNAEPNLLLKREILCKRIVERLNKVNIKKRGNVKQFDQSTIKKALSGVRFG